MPLTSTPFPLNNVASFQQENIILKCGTASISIAPRDPLIWSPSGGNAFTYTRRVRGIHRKFLARHKEEYPLDALATVTPHSGCNWEFLGDGNTPCVGESVIHAYPSAQAVSAETVAIITLLQRNTNDGVPDQLTLSQAIASVIPDILAYSPTPTDTELVSWALVFLSMRFNITAMLMHGAEASSQYDMRSDNADLFELVGSFSPYILPVLHHFLQPA